MGEPKTVEELTDLLRIWAKAVGKEHLYKLLSGEETLMQYVDGALEHGQKMLRESSQELRSETQKSEPNPFTVRSLAWI